MKIKDITQVSLFIALMVAGAFIRIPLPYLNITFQGFFSVIAGPVLGPKKAVTAMLAYMLLGLVGVPVFTEGGGFGYIFMPSFGFILGFVSGAFISGHVFMKLKKPGLFYKSVIAVITGTIFIYITGTPYMFLILRYYLQNTQYSLISAFISMNIYVLKDMLLCIPAAIIITRLSPMIRK